MAAPDNGGLWARGAELAKSSSDKASAYLGPIATQVQAYTAGAAPTVASWYAAGAGAVSSWGGAAMGRLGLQDAAPSSWLQSARESAQPLIEHGGHLVRRASVHIAGASEKLTQHAQSSYDAMSSVFLSEFLQLRQMQVSIASLLGGGLFLVILWRSLKDGAAPRLLGNSDGTYARGTLSTREAGIKCSAGVAALTRAGVRAGDAVVCVCLPVESVELALYCEVKRSNLIVLNPTSSPQEIVEAVKEWAPKVLVYDRRVAQHIDEVDRMAKELASAGGGEGMLFVHVPHSQADIAWVQDRLPAHIQYDKFLASKFAANYPKATSKSSSTASTPTASPMKSHSDAPDLGAAIQKVGRDVEKVVSGLFAPAQSRPRQAETFV